jgi:hypothetical protein
MVRMFLVALLGLSLVVVAQGDPKPGTDTKPPWQRLLSGDAARMAAEVEKRIAVLEAADIYAEALRGRELPDLESPVN